jgi:hypothetical protein
VEFADETAGQESSANQVAKAFECRPARVSPAHQIPSRGCIFETEMRVSGNQMDPFIQAFRHFLPNIEQSLVTFFHWN